PKFKIFDNPVRVVFPAGENGELHISSVTGEVRTKGNSCERTYSEMTLSNTMATAMQVILEAYKRKDNSKCDGTKIEKTLKNLSGGAKNDCRNSDRVENLLRDCGNINGVTVPEDFHAIWTEFKQLTGRTYESSPANARGRR